MDLPTPEEMYRERLGKPIAKGASRLEVRTDEVRRDKADEKTWRKGCIARDGRICRCCKRRVVPQLALAPERLEVHHVAGRADRGHDRRSTPRQLYRCRPCLRSAQREHRRDEAALARRGDGRKATKRSRWRLKR